MNEAVRLWESKKKVVVILNDGEQISTEWFEDEVLEKEIDKVNTTKTIQDNYENLLKEKNIEKSEVKHWYVQCYRDNDNIYISEHALKRLKERNGWNKKTSYRMVKKIYEDGKLKDDTTGMAKQWIRKQMSKYEDRTYKMYGDKIYIFRRNVLLTVINPKYKFDN